MDCETLRHNWGVRVRPDAPEPEETPEMRQHLEGCPACRQWVADIGTLRQALREAPEPPMRPGFADAAVTAARRRRSSARGALAGAAAALLVLGAAVGVLAPVGPGGDSVPTVALPAGDVHEVTLAVGSPRAMDDVTFTVELPEGVELAGHPGKRRVTWQGDLARGRNALELPLRSRGGEGGELVARVARSGTTKTLRVRLEVTGGAGARAPLKRGPASVVRG